MSHEVYLMHRLKQISYNPNLQSLRIFFFRQVKIVFYMEKMMTVARSQQICVVDTP